MIKGLVFDFDGLILDTESSEYQSWSEIFTIHGLELPFEKWALGIGTYPSTFDPVEYLSEVTGRNVDRAKYLEQAHQRDLELINDRDPLPGVRELILKAHGRGLKLAIASSSPREWVSNHLTRLGLMDFFDVVCTSNDVTQTKPSPDLYVCAITRLEIIPMQAVAFEDSPNGVLAAKSAGLFCVAVPNILTCRLVFPGADLIIPSLVDFNLDTIAPHQYHHSRS